MATARQWVYQTLCASQALTEIVPPSSILPGQSAMTAQIQRPFLVLKFGTDSDEQQFDDPDIAFRPHRQFLEVWCHDARPSYVQVDQVLSLVKDALRTDQTSTDAHIMAVKFLETSDDMDDHTMDTVVRYSRYQLIQSQ